MKLTVTGQLALSLLSTFAHAGKPCKNADLYVEAGSHIIYSYPGLTPPDSLLELTREGKVGGIIIFGENVDENLGNVVQNFQDAYKESPGYSGSPLLITTDQEGGIVRRLPGGPEKTAREVGDSEDPLSEATRMGQAAVEALTPFKVNSNLAPVLDVYRVEGEFIDEFGRSYGNDTEVVSTCSNAFAAAQKESNIISTAKHFPGLGAAGEGENTDEQPVTIDSSIDELRSFDCAPYEAAIKAGMETIMTSWAIYPSLDPEYPAGLSKKWVQGELRERLGFKGVTITDAIEAGSLKPFGEAGELGVMAAQAGMDLLLASGRDASQGESILEALVAALEDGTLSKREFRAGTKRIQELRSKLEW